MDTSNLDRLIVRKSNQRRSGLGQRNKSMLYNQKSKKYIAGALGGSLRLGQNDSIMDSDEEKSQKTSNS